jgi:hypothetical protein
MQFRSAEIFRSVTQFTFAARGLGLPTLNWA